MKETIVKLLQDVAEDLKSSEVIPAETKVIIKVDRTKDKKHGDFATNLALMLAGKSGMPARELAELIAAKLQGASAVEKTEIAGPGFINFFLKEEDKYSIIPKILQEQENYGRCELGNGEKVLLEFVSANPTGPLHVGHGRGAAYGATLANLLKIAGYTVDSEYYVNDSGRQMDILAASVWLRYLELNGENINFPSNGYQGEYVIDIAKDLVSDHADKFSRPWSEVIDNVSADEPAGGDKEEHINALIAKAKQLLGEDGFAIFHAHALQSVLAGIKSDLADFGVNFENWFSEKSLEDADAINQALNNLSELGHTYEKDGALWFKSSDFGDEKDRVLVRANGQNTYFAPDIAYHWHKYKRGYSKLIDVFGADHHGYVTRLKAAVRALGHPDEDLAIKLVQFANLYRDGERVPMSTRSGSFVTIKDLQAEVGQDAARFFYVMRKPDQHMDFDLDLAKSESNDNPVYYIQYAHARIASVQKQLAARDLQTNNEQGMQSLSLLSTSHEEDLMTLLTRYPDVIENAAKACEPHQVAFYLKDLATALHSYYNSVHLICEDENLRAARLCLLQAIRQVLRNGLSLLGVSSPESM